MKKTGITRFASSIVLCTGLLLFPVCLSAQKPGSDTSALHMFYPTYAFHVPAFDLRERFGVSHSIGGGYTFLSKSGWMVAAEGNFHFGDHLKNKNSILSMISTSEGQIIDEGGVYADIALFERGYSFFAKSGKLLHLASAQSKSGILTMAGAGFLQHKYRIDVKNNTAPQLSGDYKKGYDHMCNGPALLQYAGYQYLSDNRKVHFQLGIEIIEAWTQSRRAYYFNEMKRPGEKRFDMLIGIKAAWLVPITGKTKSSYYYY